MGRVWVVGFSQFSFGSLEKLCVCWPMRAYVRLSRAVGEGGARRRENSGGGGGGNKCSTKLHVLSVLCVFVCVVRLMDGALACVCMGQRVCVLSRALRGLPACLLDF